MGAIAYQITSLTIVYSTVYSDAHQRKHQSSATLAFVWGIHRGPVNSPHKWLVTRKTFLFDDVIMELNDRQCTREIVPEMTTRVTGPFKLLIGQHSAHLNIHAREFNMPRCCVTINALRLGTPDTCMHQPTYISMMMTSWNGNSFRVTGLLCGEFTDQIPVTRGFDVFFDLGLFRQLGKQWRRRWFETP